MPFRREGMPGERAAILPKEGQLEKPTEEKARAMLSQGRKCTSKTWARMSTLMRSRFSY